MNGDMIKLAGGVVACVRTGGGAAVGTAKLAIRGVEAQIGAHVSDGTIHPEAARRIAALAGDAHDTAKAAERFREEQREVNYQTQRKLDALLIELQGRLPANLPPAEDFAPAHAPDGGVRDGGRHR